MKNVIFLLMSFAIVATACSDDKTEEKNNPAGATDAGSVQDWKLGAALWTFHTVDFPM